MRFSIIVSCLPVVIRAYFFSKARFLKYDNLLQQSPQESHLSALYMCVGTEVRATSPPLPNNDGKKSDSDPSWRTTKVSVYSSVKQQNVWDHDHHYYIASRDGNYCSIQLRHFPTRETSVDNVLLLEYPHTTQSEYW